MAKSTKAGSKPARIHDQDLVRGQGGELLPSAAATADLVKESAAFDFVADAFAHCKFIGQVEAALPLLEKAGIADNLDAGVITLGSSKDVAGFLKALGALRLWSREQRVKV
jgi:catalase